MVTYEKYAEIRNSKGMKDSDVAKKAGFHQSVLSDWKRNISCPKIDKMQKIADALEMDYFDFVGPIGLYSSLNPNRPTSQKMTFNADLAAMTAEEQNILIEIIKDRESKEHLIEYARLLQLKLKEKKEPQ